MKEKTAYQPPLSEEILFHLEQTILNASGNAEDYQKGNGSW